MVTSGAQQGYSAEAPNGTMAKAGGPYISAGSAFLDGHIGNITKMDWSSDSKYLISQDDAGYICIWEVSANRLIARLEIISDGAPKSIVWAPDGKSFYIPGTPDRLLTDPSTIRERIEENYTGSPLTMEDIQRYELERIALQSSDIRNRILASGDSNLLSAIADFYERRAELRPSGAAADQDAATAKRFREAADQ